MLLSICVSVYNGEKYLRNCLDTLVDQTIPKKEICIVDDGSTDGTLAILKEYESRYSYIHIKHQSNKGLSLGRKASVEMASGDYIGFVDVDDTIEKDMFEKMLAAAVDGDYDIVECRVDLDGRLLNNRPHGEYAGIDIYKKLLSEGGVLLPLWSRIYKKNLFEKNVFYEKQGINNEDVFATPILFSRCKKYYMMPEEDKLYHYSMENDESITNKGTARSIKNYIKTRDFLFVRNHIEEYSEYREMRELTSKYLERFIISTFYAAGELGVSYKFFLDDICELLGKTKKEAESEIKEYFRKYNPKRYICLKMLGLSMMMRISYVFCWAKAL